MHTRSLNVFFVYNWGSKLHLSESIHSPSVTETRDNLDYINCPRTGSRENIQVDCRQSSGAVDMMLQKLIELMSSCSWDIKSPTVD